MKRLLPLLVLLVSFQPIYAWEFINKSGETVTLDQCEEQDLPYCKEVFVTAFLEAYKDFSEEQLAVQDKQQFLQSAFSDVYDDFHEGLQKILVAKLDGTIIGFAGFKPTDEPGQVYISQLAVTPAHWRSGIGKELVFASLRLYENCSHLAVIPRRINQVARNFYLKLGFTESNYMHPGYNPQKYVGYEWHLAQEP